MVPSIRVQPASDHGEDLFEPDSPIDRETFHPRYERDENEEDEEDDAGRPLVLNRPPSFPKLERPSPFFSSGRILPE